MVINDNKIVNKIRDLIIYHEDIIKSKGLNRFRNLMIDSLASEVDSETLLTLSRFCVNGFLSNLLKATEKSDLLTQIHQKAMIELGYKEELVIESLRIWEEVISSIDFQGERFKAISQSTSELSLSNADSPETSASDNDKNNGGKSVFLLIFGVGVLILLLIRLTAIVHSNTSHTQNSQSSQKVTSVPQQETEPPEEINSPTSAPIDETEAVQNVIKKWQDIKRQAFLQYDTSNLDQVLRGNALEETVGGVNWWKNTPNANYYDIKLESLNFKSTDFQDSGNKVIVKVQIVEEKSNSAQGTKTSNYEATYTLEKDGSDWYITLMQAN